MTKIKIGSRKSELALWQARTVAAMLNQNGWDTQIIAIETKGDKILDRPIAKIGSKGVFTEELEHLLQKGTIHMAVHSAKDMPANLPAGFRLIAFTEREKANDVLVSSNDSLCLENADQPITVGTSSVRRTAMLRHYHPHVKAVNIRGNLQTRVNKMTSGVCDALILAYAGVKRMNFHHLIIQELPLHQFVPPVGQGSMAVEVYENLDRELKHWIRESVNHGPTETALTAERAYLKQLQGGCSIPAFALGTCLKDMVRLTAGLIGLDGKVLLKQTISGKAANAAEIGTRVGMDILTNGGREILDEIRNSCTTP